MIILADTDATCMRNLSFPFTKQHIIRLVEKKSHVLAKGELINLRDTLYQEDIIFDYE